MQQNCPSGMTRWTPWSASPGPLRAWNVLLSRWTTILAGRESSEAGAGTGAWDAMLLRLYQTRVLGAGCWVLGVGCSVLGDAAPDLVPQHPTPNTRDLKA